MIRIFPCVLAGGRSERFGEDKRFFKFKGKTLLKIAIEKLRGFSERVYVICDDKNFMEDKLKKEGVTSKIEIVEDIEKYKGPLYGIYSFFKTTGNKFAFFVPVDMPFLPVKFIKYFLDVAMAFKLQKIIIISRDKPLPIFINFYFLQDIEKYLKVQNSIKGFIEFVRKKRDKKMIYEIPKENLLTFGNPKVYLKNINTRGELR